ncbi:MAG: 5'-nucleotidase C-terminal domain-containing protein [Thermoanaerobaculaceae bacterium]|nr:5'-nucleotidase C-terminal domain-containing protein [Thermoanaerobaculaceae bacterium]MDI9622619.1 5'-nucleotidase C-terminal domain-containing protein [Acidobacteriota bacterium]NLH10871.1 bifunctional metallophosphatase/5'-nucleotidase [Holophagae bacterium]
MSAGRVAAVLLLAWTAFAAEPERMQLTLLITSGLSGRLVATPGHTVAALVATVRSEAELAAAEGRHVVVLDAGRTLAPYAESRFDAGQTMIRMLAAAGCRAFAPDAMDYSVTPVGMSRLAAQAPFPLLRPFDSTARDGLVRSTRLAVTPELHLRIANLLDRHFAGDLAAAGVEEDLGADPAAALSSIPLDGDLGIAVVHSAGHSRDLASHELTWRLVWQGPPFRVLIDPDLGADIAARHDTREGPVVLIGRRQRKEQPWSFARVDLELVRSGAEWVPTTPVLRTIEADLDIPTDAALEAEVHKLLGEFRSALSVPLPLGAPTTWEGLRDFVLETLREAAKAEVAMLNYGAIRPVDPSFFATLPLTLETVGRMLSIDQHMATLTLTGRQLVDLATISAGRVDATGAPRMDSLLFAGLTYELDGPAGLTAKLKNIKINGRPIQLDDPYLVATSSYLLAGGDDFAALQGLPSQPLPGPSGRAAELRDDIVFPRLRRPADPFPDLARRPLWRWGIDRLGLVFEGVKVSRNPDYDQVPDSRVQARDSAAGTVEARLRADRYQTGLAWENRFRLRFGLINAQDAELRETDDVAALDSSLILTGIGLVGGSPYAGLTLDSELRRNLDATGQELPRRLDRSLAAGLAWTHPRWPRLRVGVQARRSASGPDHTLAGLVGEAQLLVPPRQGRPGIDARLLAESMHGAGATITRLDLDLRLLVALKGALALSPGLNFYAFNDSSRSGTVRYARLSVGLTYGKQRKLQKR